MIKIKNDKGGQKIEKSLSVSGPTISRTIQPEDPADLGKLGVVVRKSVLADPTAIFRKSEESGAYILSGNDPLQLELLVKRIRAEIPIKVGIPTLIYREAVLDRGIEFESTCSEGLNTINLYIEPLNAKTLKLLSDGTVQEHQDEKERAALLCSTDWDIKEALQIWAIEGNNILINGTEGIERLDRIQRYIIDAFRDFCSSSALAKEPAVGLKVVVTDAAIHEDPSHTRSAQIFVMTFRALTISFLTANPALFEPILGKEFLKFDLLPNHLQEGKILEIRKQKKSMGQEVALTLPCLAHLPESWKKRIFAHISQYKNRIIIQKILNDFEPLK